VTSSLQSSEQQVGKAGPQILVAIPTATLLSVVQIMVPRPMLILERFRTGGGWIEIALLAAYAAWLYGKMRDPKKAPVWRSRIWRLFSLVFFGQLLVGLLIDSRFLMTGTLHLPIPALILAGPIYRAKIVFMPILFLSTAFLVGPAWCSHLCYVGAWDDLASRARRIPSPLPRWRRPVRVGIFSAVATAALILRFSSAPPLLATWIAVAFGAASIAVMLTWSRRAGQMTHCLTACPIGLVGNWFGRLHPFRIRLAASCTDCQACRRACRYDALTSDDIRRRSPGPSCTLCGDCLASCHAGAIGYRFPGLTPDAARRAFLVLIVTLHAVFLGLARI